MALANLQTLAPEDELLKECGFWKAFTGDVRSPAHSSVTRFYWLTRCFLRALVILLKEHRSNSSADILPRTQCELLFVYFTNNQYQAFRAWHQSKRPEIQYASSKSDADWHISRKRCAILSLKYLLPTYRLLCRRADSAETIPWLEEFVRYQAGLILADELYGKANPLAVVFSNDHSGLVRAFIRVARRRGAKLIYTQHGSIGKGFPALNFDLSLLDGVQAYSQYSESGITVGEVVLTGRIHHPPQYDEKLQAGVGYVGLATNRDDCLLEWIKLIRKVSACNCKIIMRCHPAELRRPAWRLICWMYHIEMDTGSLNDFIKKSTVVISGMSGIILDAAIRGVPSLVKLPQRMNSPQMVDYYGFEKFGLCRRIATLADIPKLLIETCGHRIDPMLVSAFEAGLITEPEEEKRAAVSIFLSNIKNSSTADRLKSRYIHIAHLGMNFWTTPEYADAIKKHGWITLPSTQVVKNDA